MASTQRLCVMTVLVLFSMALIPYQVRSSCNGVLTGACPSGEFFAWVDCDCDQYGCSEPGPPYLICVDIGCNKAALICSGEAGYLQGCYPINLPPLQCPCPFWFMCAY